MAYTDNKMIYDLAKHAYRLTIDAANEVCDVANEYGSEDKAEASLKDQSQTSC